MNQENFDYLKNQVKFTGFGEGLENDLKTNIEQRQPTFQLHYEHAFGKDQAVATLNFRRSDQNDMYFFNSYRLGIHSNNNNEQTAQTFFIGKDNNFTLKEAYNLMNGRAVNKDLVNRDGEKYNSWVQLNFKETDASGNYKLKHFHENYGYDLGAALNKLPIKELAVDQDKARLIESLQKGNRQSVTFIQEGAEQKRFIEANPQFKSVTVYDSNMKRVRLDQAEQEGQSEAKTQKQTQKEGPGEDDGSGNKQKKANRKRHGIA